MPVEWKHANLQQLWYVADRRSWHPLKWITFFAAASSVTILVSGRACGVLSVRVNIDLTCARSGEVTTMRCVWRCDPVLCPPSPLTTADHPQVFRAQCSINHPYPQSSFYDRSQRNRGWQWLIIFCHQRVFPERDHQSRVSSLLWPRRSDVRGALRMSCQIGWSDLVSPRRRRRGSPGRGSGVAHADNRLLRGRVRGRRATRGSRSLSARINGAAVGGRLSLLQPVRLEGTAADSL